MPTLRQLTSGLLNSATALPGSRRNMRVVSFRKGTVFFQPLRVTVEVSRTAGQPLRAVTLFSSDTQHGHALCIRRRHLHTSSWALAPTSPSNQRVSRASSAADSLLLRWSRRSAAYKAPAPETASTAVKQQQSSSPQQQQQPEDAIVDSLSVEELLDFDEGEPKRKSAPLPASRPQNGGSSDLGMKATGYSKQAPLGTPAPAASPTASEGLSTFSLPNEEISEEDADVYGIAASAATLERQLMDDLLQQASLNTVAELNPDLVDDNDNVDHNANSKKDEEFENEEDSDDAQADSFFRRSDTQGALGRAVASPSPASGVEDDTAIASRSGGAVAEKTVGSFTITKARPLTREGGNEDPSALASGVGGVADSVDAPHGTPAELESDSSADEMEADKGEDEDASLDTILEEEADRMLQAALANMAKESAVKATAAAAASSGVSRSQVGGTDGYVFFSKEAVMAAAESLAASEQTPTRRHGTGDGGGADVAGRAGSAATAASDSGADFDDDAVREAEMESLGLDMETSKR